MHSLAEFVAQSDQRSARQLGSAMGEQGERIGPYRILGSLGTGGMGVVYRAQHTVSRHLAALKTVRLPSPQWLSGIRREILALTRVRHPGVVRIVAQGVHDGLPWYAMDLLDGETLRVRLRRHWGDGQTKLSTAPRRAEESTEVVVETAGRLSLSSGLAVPASGADAGAPERQPLSTEELRGFLRIFGRLCHTLAFLHGEGIVNGDLKPENILVLPEQRPVIIDFGLTASFGGPIGREILESARGLAGTLPYIAPEQIRNEFIDARADLYAVGCMLYEAVTGMTPFDGSPTEMLDRHLHSRPLPPRELVAELPLEINSLVLKLLEKQLPDRAGYASDVAKLLSTYVRDEVEATFPEPRPYLYRPRFSGRQNLVAQLNEDLARAVKGQGRLVLAAGESGVGKTRFAMEATRLARERGMRVITGECAAVSSSASSTAVGFVPLSALKPLLQAIADQCQTEGREFADRVLGPRGPVLALYEPALAHVPGQNLQPVPPPLPSHSSRRRLFAYLAETLAAFTRDRPTLLVIDDLHWADELTLAFLRWLPSQFWAANPLVAQVNFREEQINAQIEALIALQHARLLKLGRLDSESVRQIVSDLLAGSSSALATLVDFLVLQSEGNPFFVIEYLRAAVSAGILQRRPFESWRVAAAPPVGGPIAYEALPVPRVLRDLIQQRLQALPPQALALLETAAVIGREMDEALLLKAHGPAPRPTEDLIDELITRQIIERAGDETLRFVHDKLREVTYDSIAPARLRPLHGAIGEALAAQYEDHPEAASFWPRLGYHFALAGVANRALEYLARAADHARARNANHEAVSLYRSALVQLQHVSPEGEGSPENLRAQEIELREALADLLTLAGQREEARREYQTALERLAPAQLLARSRVIRKIGKTWETQQQQDEALRHYAQALATLGSEPAGGLRESWREEWVQVRSDQVFANYWLNDVPAMESLVQSLREVVQAGTSSPRQRIRLHRAEMHLCFRRDRYAISQVGVEHARAALNECLSIGDLSELPMTHFNFAFALFLRGDFEAADWELRTALAAAERAGDVAHQARCLTYLAVNARRSGQVESARLILARCYATAQAGGTHEYVGAAQAHEAWLAYVDSDLVRGEALARAALATWNGLTIVFPFQWTALFPLIQAALLRDDIIGATQYAQILLAPPQQRLPSQIETSLREACRCMELGDLSGARQAFEGGLSQANESRFL